MNPPARKINGQWNTAKGLPPTIGGGSGDGKPDTTKVDLNTGIPTSGDFVPGVNNPLWNAEQAAANASTVAASTLNAQPSTILGISWKPVLTWVLAGAALYLIFKFIRKKK